jgi:hypothetical protein
VTLSKQFNVILNLSKNDLGNSLFNLGGSETIRIIDLAKLITRKSEHLFDRKVAVEQKNPL